MKPTPRVGRRESVLTSQSVGDSVIAVTCCHHLILILFLALASADLAGSYELPERRHALPSQCLVCACAKSLSRVQLFATPWTVALQAPLSVGILQARILEWVASPFSRD